MDDSLRKNKPKDHVSPNRQSNTNAPNTHDLRKRRQRDINEWNRKVAIDFSCFDVSLLLMDSSLLKKKSRSYFAFALAAAWCINADTKFWNECAFGIWHWVKRYFLGLPWSCWLKSMQTQQVSPWRLPGKPRGNMITFQSVSMTTAIRYRYSREQRATPREVRWGGKKWDNMSPRGSTEKLHWLLIRLAVQFLVLFKQECICLVWIIKVQPIISLTTFDTETNYIADLRWTLINDS